MRERFVITDGNGRAANIELWIENGAMRYLSGLDVAEPLEITGRYNAEWRALTLGALGAQSGTIRILRGAGDNRYSQNYHLIIRAQLSRGVRQDLGILKSWFTDGGLSRDGTGTLFHGVNTGLQSGEMTWSFTRHSN